MRTKQPHAIACASRFRLASYRKIWSSIERAMARLQGEWEVGRATWSLIGARDIPMRWCCMLALARCGALLLPLEHAAARAALPQPGGQGGADPGAV